MRRGGRRRAHAAAAGVSRVAVTWAVVACAVAVAPAAEPKPALAIDVAGFLARHADDVVSPLDMPQVACAVRALIAEEDVGKLRDRIGEGTGAGWSRSLDADGGHAFHGEWPRSSDCEIAVLWIHPDGRLFGGFIEGCDPLQAFTNSSGLASELPVAVRKILDRANHGTPKWPGRWLAPPVDAPMSHACSSERLAREIAATDRRLDGSRCDAARRFFAAQVVRPARGDRAPMGGVRIRPVAGRGSAPYLVAGDRVEAGEIRGECRCVRYVRRTAWMRTDDLRALREPDPWTSEGVAAWVPGPAATDDALLGGWRTSVDASWMAQLVIRRGANGLLLGGEGSRGYALGSVLDVPLTRAGAGAWGCEPDAGCCLAAVPVGRALWVSDNGSCGGQAFTFTGLYQRAMDVKLEPGD